MLLKATRTLKELIKKQVQKQYPAEKVNLESDGEEMLAGDIRIFGMPAPERNLKIVPGHGWRFDFVWSSEKLAIEVQGAIWKPQGHHTFGERYEGDLRKYNAAQELGWKVMQFSTEMVKRGEATSFLRRFFHLDPKP